MTITEFLTARYDEEEARAALYRRLAAGLGKMTGMVPPETGDIGPLPAAQVAIQRTADRILADIAAKRAIVAHHAQVLDTDGDPMGDTCSICTETGPDAQVWPCQTVRLLVQPYAEHADFDEEWRVSQVA